MAAISAGVPDEMHLNRGERAVAARAKPDPCRHLVPGRRADELLLARELPSHRPPGLQRSKDAEVLRKHLLLAAEPAPHSLGEHVNVAHAQPKKVTELLFRDEWRLRAGADVDAPVLAGPRDGTGRL